MALILVAALVTATLLHVYMEGYPRGTARRSIYCCSCRHSADWRWPPAVTLRAFFLGLELLSVPMYGMAAYFVKERRSLEAGMKYLVLSAVASAFIAFGMALVYSQSGTLVFSEIGTSVANVTTWGACRDDSRRRHAVDRHRLQAVARAVPSMDTGLSMRARRLRSPRTCPPPRKSRFLRCCCATSSRRAATSTATLVDALSVLAVLSIVVGNVLALQQENLKRLLAYSSIAHFGYLLVALIASGPLAIEAVGVYLLTYMVTTLAAFGVITPDVEPRTRIATPRRCSISAACSGNVPGSPPPSPWRCSRWREFRSPRVSSASSISWAPVSTSACGVLIAAVVLGSARRALLLFACIGRALTCAPAGWRRFQPRPTGLEAQAVA